MKKYNSIFQSSLLLATSVLLFTGCAKKGGGVTADKLTEQHHADPTTDPLTAPAPLTPPAATGTTTGSPPTAIPPDKIIPSKKKDLFVALTCLFHQEEKDELKKREGNKTLSCTASAKFSFDDEDKDKDKEEGRSRAALAIACNGESVYADGAEHVRMNGVDYLLAHLRSSSEDESSKHHPKEKSILLTFLADSHHKEMSESAAHLNIGHKHSLEGACRINWIEE